MGETGAFQYDLKGLSSAATHKAGDGESSLESAPSTNIMSARLQVQKAT